MFLFYQDLWATSMSIYSCFTKKDVAGEIPRKLFGSHSVVQFKTTEVTSEKLGRMHVIHPIILQSYADYWATGTRISNHSVHVCTSRCQIRVLHTTIHHTCPNSSLHQSPNTHWSSIFWNPLQYTVHRSLLKFLCLVIQSYWTHCHMVSRNINWTFWVAFNERLAVYVSPFTSVNWSRTWAFTSLSPATCTNDNTWSKVPYLTE